MMQNLTIATTAAAMLAATATAQVPLPPANQVSGQWIVEYADNACKAQLEIHLGSDRWIVTLEPKPASDETLIGLVVPQSSPDLDTSAVLIEGQPVKSIGKGMALVGTTANGSRFYRKLLFGPDYARLLTYGSFTLEAGSKTIGFILPKMPAVQRQLDACVKDLLVAWGYSLEKQAELASFPTTDRPITSYFTDNDYPTAALGSPGGNTSVRVNVRIDGRAEKCLVTQTSGRADLDETTCAVILKRARFFPARAKAGEPMEAPFVATIRWRTG